MSTYTKATAGPWIADLRRRIEAGDLVIADPPPEDTPKADYPGMDAESQARYQQLVTGYHLEQHDQDLRQILRGKLPDLPHFHDFRGAWRHRRPAHGALILGAQRTGKSVMALWAAFDTVRQGGAFAWMDSVDFHTLVERRNWHAVDELRSAPLTVLDSGEDVGRLTTSTNTELRAVLRARYRRGLPIIICADTTLPKLRVALGRDVVARFPSALTVRLGG